MSKKVVFIDLDDTLWDTQRNNKTSLHELFEENGWGRFFTSFEEYYHLYSEGNHRLWTAYNRGDVDKVTLSKTRLQMPLKGHLELSDEACKILDRRFLDLVGQKTQLCPHALPVLRWLKRHFRVCILSNGFGEVQYRKLEGSGLSPWVDEVILSESLGINKPDARLFSFALERMHTQSACAVMIGDSWESDIVGARGVGMDAIWYNPHGASLPDGEAKPWGIITDLRQVIDLLRDAGASD